MVIWSEVGDSQPRVEVVGVIGRVGPEMKLRVVGSLNVSIVLTCPFTFLRMASVAQKQFSMGALLSLSLSSMYSRHGRL